MPMALVPLNDRVLVRPVEKMNEFGILLPETSKEKPQEGYVLAAGEGRYDEHGRFVPTTVRAGDRILMAKYATTDVKLNGQTLYIVKEDDIMGILVEVDENGVPLGMDPNPDQSPSVPES